ncbi:HIRAN domain-containing protein [Cryobacterium sp. Hh38]|uniref:HIRAN domain-containing protein n=1 Tax=Cryobacterium sp. Hh38 TaxID=1259156 RepID=UPI001068E9DB|nr:HIRAN domain-containing protein [Cryobacterium sp. Hh38]TFD66091.1 hypothetical protein E3T41_00090 [Cryobacterium sp. Hh38]
MATQGLEDTRTAALQSARRLLLIWQNPATRKFVQVGQLDHLLDGKYVFQYLPAATTDPDFFALDEYPVLDRSYVSSALPVFFANRIMSSGRASYQEYLEWHGLQDAESIDVPMELLARTGGGRATDTFHVVEHPVRSTGTFSSRFFVSGLRHVDGGAERVRTLSEGANLSLRSDEENEHNPQAVVVDTDHLEPIGWVPDWLCDEVSALRSSGWQLEAIAERVNPEAPVHVQVLCRIDARWNEPAPAV